MQNPSKSAAWHLANQEGACGLGSIGDLYGNFIPQLLDKYYSLSYKDLNILKVEGEDMGGDTDYEDNAIAIIEYILAQRHIDTSILKSWSHLHIGIGCACSQEQSYMCYIVTAQEVVGNIIAEKMPYFQDFVDTANGEECIDLCPFLYWNDEYPYGEFYD